MMWYASICVLIITLTTSGVSAAKPSIGFISPDVVADIGGTVELTCTITNGKEYPILWMRKGSGGSDSLPISTGPNLIIRDPRFKLDYEPDTGSYQLEIGDVQKSDEARYQCQVVVTVDNMVTADVDLKIKVPPVMAEDGEPITRAAVGQKAELTCSASGYPSPEITWRRQDGTLLPSGLETFKSPRIVLSNVQREDRGNYVCTAENGVGASQQRVINLEVEFPPAIDVPKPRVPQAMYYEAHLVCEIKAFPPPAIKWKKGDKFITNGANYHITHFASADEKTTSTLKIYSVDEENYGKYSCEAANRHGSASQHMELYESTMPICPPLCGNTDLNAATRDLTSKSTFLAIVLATLAAFHV